MMDFSQSARTAMVLTEADPHRLLFQFQGKTWAWTNGAMGAWLLAAAGFMGWQSGFAPYHALFAVFALFLLRSAFYAAINSRGLEIDRRRGSVRYAESTLRRKDLWEKPFSEFASVSVHYPRFESGGRRKTPRHLSVEIVTRHGEYYRVSTRASGHAPETAARELAARIGDMMGLPVVSSIGKN
jgi:hypothetical protein